MGRKSKKGFPISSRTSKTPCCASALSFEIREEIEEPARVIAHLRSGIENKS